MTGTHLRQLVIAVVALCSAALQAAAQDGLPPETAGEAIGSAVGDAAAGLSEYLQARSTAMNRLYDLKRTVIECGDCPDRSRLQAAYEEMLRGKQFVTALENHALHQSGLGRYGSVDNIIDQMEEELGVMTKRRAIRELNAEMAREIETYCEKAFAHDSRLVRDCKGSFDAEEVRLHGDMVRSDCHGRVKKALGIASLEAVENRLMRALYFDVRLSCERKASLRQFMRDEIERSEVHTDAASTFLNYCTLRNEGDPEAFEACLAGHDPMDAAAEHAAIHTICRDRGLAAIGMKPRSDIGANYLGALPSGYGDAYRSCREALPGTLGRARIYVDANRLGKARAMALGARSCPPVKLPDNTWSYACLRY